jgi:hypothetical protein
LLVLVVAVAGGVLLTGLAGARRTESAYRRMLAAADAGTLLLYAPDVTPAQLAALPEVEDHGRATYVLARFPTLGDEGRQVVPFAALDDHQFRTIDRPRVLEGRLADPDRADEVVVSDTMADQRGLAVGSILPIRVFEPHEEVLGSPGDPQPTGPPVDLRVTGIVRGILDVGRDYDDADVDYAGSGVGLTLTPAFAERHLDSDLFADAAYRVRLRGNDDDLASFTEGVARLAAGGPVGPEAQREVTDRIQRGLDVPALALLLFGTGAGLLGLLLVGQSLTRQSRGDLRDADALRAIGLRPFDLLAVGVSRSFFISLAGAVGALVLAVAASPLFPIGLARRAEPSPGFDVDGLVLGVGTVAILFVLVVPIIVAVWWRLERGELAESATRPGGLGLPDRLARVGAAVPVTTGVRLALDRGHGARAVPLRTTIAGAVLGLAAIVAVVVFGQSLSRLVNEPTRQGWNWDVVVGNPNAGESVPRAEEALASSRIVDGFTSVLSAGLPLGDSGVTALGLEQQEGEVGPPLLDGRLPAAADEVAFDVELLRRFDLAIGDHFTSGVDRMLVVGEIAFPDAMLDVGEGAEGGAVLTEAGALALEPPTDFPTRWLVDLGPGVDLAEARRELGPTFGRTVLGPLRPDDVEYVARVAWMPYAMAGLVAAFAAATVGHVLVASIRRRRDLAILKTLGLGRRDVRAVVAWQATTLGVVALLVAVPAGVATGRWAWMAVAERLGARSEPLVEPVVLVLLIVAALLVMNVIAAVPGRMAARVRPAVVLRSE